MRLAVCVLTCVAASVVTSALADPGANASSATPATPASATPAAAVTPAPATAAAAAHPASSAAPAGAENPGVEISASQMDQLEKHFLSEGYKIEMHHGEQYFCRREEEVGSRLGGQKRCSPAQQLMFTEKDARRQLEHAQRNQTSSP